MKQHTMKHGSLSHDGNLANVGNFDEKGVNGNNWKPDNANDNIGVSLSRSVRDQLDI